MVPGHCAAGTAGSRARYQLPPELKPRIPPCTHLRRAGGCSRGFGGGGPRIRPPQRQGGCRPGCASARRRRREPSTRTRRTRASRHLPLRGDGLVTPPHQTSRDPHLQQGLPSGFSLPQTHAPGATSSPPHPQRAPSCPGRSPGQGAVSQGSSCTPSPGQVPPSPSQCRNRRRLPRWSTWWKQLREQGDQGVQALQPLLGSAGTDARVAPEQPPRHPHRGWCKQRGRLPSCPRGAGGPRSSPHIAGTWGCTYRGRRACGTRAPPGRPRRRGLRRGPRQGWKGTCGHGVVLVPVLTKHRGAGPPSPAPHLNLSCVPTPQLRSQGVHGDQADQPQGMGQGSSSHVTAPSWHTLGTEAGLSHGDGDKKQPPGSVRGVPGHGDRAGGTALPLTTGCSCPAGRCGRAASAAGPGDSGTGWR